MYYIEGVKNGVQLENRTLGGTIREGDRTTALVRDTKDMVLEEVDCRTLKKLIMDKKVKIYGLDRYNGLLEFLPFKFGATFDVGELKRLLKNRERLNNPWTAFRVETYIASLVVGTEIAYSGSTEDGIEQTRLRKLDADRWLGVSSSDYIWNGEDSLPNERISDIVFVSWGECRSVLNFDR